ncbi:unnamed protein product, partial [Larinioides sclopetarius]
MQNPRGPYLILSDRLLLSLRRGSGGDPDNDRRFSMRRTIYLTVTLPSPSLAHTPSGLTRENTRMKKVAPPPPPLSNGSVQQGRRTSSSGDSKPPLPTTTPGEDCTFDELLEGRMDLE